MKSFGIRVKLFTLPVIGRGLLGQLFAAMAVLSSALVVGCSGTAPKPSAQSLPQAVAVLPKGVFDDASALPAKNLVDRSVQAAAPGVRETVVLLYASDVTANYFQTLGWDFKTNVRLWETFLQKYKVPFKMLRTVEQLEASRGGALVLPSSVALSDRERAAMAAFRARGGSVLATWLAGVRNGTGGWQGFDFMQRVLDVGVVGDTEGEDDETFLMPYGNTPVTHQLPAGMRLWLERAKGWYPLRLQGGHAAAQMMDWSRTEGSGKTGATIVFDERGAPDRGGSRSVVLGFSERLWMSADPVLMEAVVHNALMWVLHQPDAYLSAWPHPYDNAAVVAVEGVDNFGVLDLKFADRVESIGARATYFVSSGNLAKSLDFIKKLGARGHEIAYFGDSFEGFRNQTRETQSKRLRTMRQTMEGAGLPMASDAGFRAPMDAYDAVTQQLLQEQRFGYQVAFMDASDGRLPFVSPRAGGAGGAAMVVLPRTLQGPEEFLEQAGPEEGLTGFLHALDTSRQMGGLSIVAVPNQSLLTPEQLDEIFGALQDGKDRAWLTTAGQVARWWREYDRATAAMTVQDHTPHLSVTVREGGTIQGAVAVWINLPERGSVVRLSSRSPMQTPVKIVSLDAWRSGVLLTGLQPGVYDWELHFEKGPTSHVSQ